MRQFARQILRVCLLTVAITASSLNGYAAALAAFDAHMHGDHGLHSHAAHDHDRGAGHDGHVDTDPSDDGPVSSDDGVCKHMHVHCCSAFAVPAAECGLKLTDAGRPVVQRIVSPIPPGEGTASLFRPPRSTA